MSQALPRDLKLKFSHPFFQDKIENSSNNIDSYLDLLYFVLTKHRVLGFSHSVVYLFNSPIVIIVSAHNLGDFLDIERGLLVMGYYLSYYYHHISSCATVGMRTGASDSHRENVCARILIAGYIKCLFNVAHNSLGSDITSRKLVSRMK